LGETKNQTKIQPNINQQPHSSVRDFESDE